MKYSNSTVTTEENHIKNCKNIKMLRVYKELRTIMFKYFDKNAIKTGATSYYVHWDIVGMKQRQFANIYIQKAKIRIETLVPLRNYNIGENVPDTHKYTLNYRTDIFENEDIEKVKGIILDSYNQIKQLI